MLNRKTMILATLLLLLLWQLKGQTSKQFAGFIFSFTQYVEWPKEYQEGNFIVGLYGDSPNFSEIKDIFLSRTINQQMVVVKNFHSPQEITKCHMVIISSQTGDLLDPVLEKFKPYHTLIITEKSGMNKKIPGISLITKEGKISFELNHTSIINKGLTIDNQFKTMASITY